MENQSSTTKVRGKKVKSYDGVKFGMLTVVRDDGWIYFKEERKRLVWCVCDCGVQKRITMASILNKSIVSCGCKQRATAKYINFKHGMRSTRFYAIYSGMLKRCNNPNCKEYRLYGGRGIKCEFSSFEEFYTTMFDGYSDNLTIERKDVNGNYSLSNCKWITRQEQSRNKRETIRYSGMALIDYCEMNNLSINLIRRRISNGWDIEKAINTRKLLNRWDKP